MIDWIGLLEYIFLEPLIRAMKSSTMDQKVDIITRLNSENFQNFHFEDFIVIFEGNIIEMITSVNSQFLGIHPIYEFR